MDTHGVESAGLQLVATSQDRHVSKHAPCVLIVDDEPFNRQLLEVMLVGEQVQLQSAASGEEALAMVATRPPDLILLDIMMPGLNGYQVAAKLKGNHTTANIPVIMVTALDDQKSRMFGLSAGAEDFLTKPVDRHELCTRVRNLLRLKAYSDDHHAYNQMLEEVIAERTTDLRDERDRAQRYLDTAGVILLALDEQGRITLINRYACSTLGWSAQDLLGKDWIESCVPERLWGAIKDKFRDMIGGDLPVNENPIITRDGVERLIEWRNTVIRDDTGRITGSLSSGTDVTERVAAVEALKITDERMRFALEAANVGIWDMDYKTGVLQWSTTLEAQYGLAPGTFGGTFETFAERIHPDDRAPVLAALGKAMAGGTDFSVVHRTLWPDGTVRWLSGSGRIILEDGAPSRGSGISLDITERRVLEEQFQHAQKMEAVGRLAGGVAHDFNNLLTVILGFCELLLAERPRDEPGYTDIEEIQKAGRQGAGLTQQLLAFSRKQIIAPTALALNVVVKEMEVMLTRLIGENINIVLRLTPELGTLTADRSQVEQILMNLAVNARDAMPHGGTLTIETANIELDDEYAEAHHATKPGSYVGLIVTDTGTGMTPETQARLFEPFFTTKEPGKGTGLGMATVYGIVQRSGGSVSVYSELGNGTAFRVYFPRNDGAEIVVDTPAPSAVSAPGSHTVLLVEDEEGLRELSKRLLIRHGYAVLVAASAEEAVRLFEANPAIDVLLTDVVMPGASGPELTRKLMEQRPTLRVIYMSGYTEEAIVQHGVLKPGIAFLNKPFTSAALAGKVREVLGQ